MDSRIHRIAAAGNAVALCSLILLLSQTERLFQNGAALEGLSDKLEARTAEDPPPTGPRSRVMLVVVDGLRADTAFNPQAMPRLHRISSRGEQAISQVQGTVPSSLAGIVALASGRISPAGESLFDFRSPPSPRGGMFEVIAGRGGQTFVAGPTLWTDLYGQWIDEAEPDTTFGRRDQHLLAATLRSLESDRHTLTVVHFGCTDAAAHQYGTASPEYLAAAQWCDQAIERIHQTLQPSTYLVVTSDHGNTRRGGHAGPEPEVMATPLIIAAPANAARLPPILPDSPVPQTAIPGLLLGLLGMPVVSTAQIAASAPLDPPASMQMVSLSIVLLWLAPLCGFGICTAVARHSDGRRPAFTLNACFWIAAVIALGGWPRVAFLLAAIVLCLTAMGATGARPSCLPLRWSTARWNTPARTTVRTNSVTSTAASTKATGGALWLLVGAVIGGGRFADGQAALALGPSSGVLAATVPLFAWLAYRGFGLVPAILPIVANASKANALKANVPKAKAAVRESPQVSSLQLPRLGLWSLLVLSASVLGGIPLLAVTGLAITLGSAVGRRLEPASPRQPPGSPVRAFADRPRPQELPWRMIFAGAVASVLQILLSRIQGETVSLSTIDVRTAFEAVELPFGIGFAVIIVIASQALPTIALLVGCGSWLTGLSGPQLSYFCSGAFAVAVGQVAFGVLLLSIPTAAEPWESMAAPRHALAVGTILRALAEAVYLFLGLAGLLLLHRSPPASQRPTAMALHAHPTIPQ